MTTFIPSRPPQSIRIPSMGDVISWNDHTFVLGDEVGEGNFGKVYECTDEWGNELVAKVLLPKGRSYDEVRDEWGRELRNLVNLRHPNITFVRAAFEHEHTFYIIVERCWLTLQTLIDSGHGAAWLAHAARDILYAVEFIHSNGYVHKDLHAGNVFVSRVVSRLDPSATPDIRFKVGDFGISNHQALRPGTLMAQWMLPPEYLNDAHGPLDHHVDIYHVGLLMLSLTLGHVPQFTTEEILAGRPRQVAEALQLPHAPAIARALRRTVAFRTASAIDFWRELRAFGLGT